MLFVVTLAGFAGLVIYEYDGEKDSVEYYVTTKASSDGEELTEVSRIMSLCLKDTGDCGVFLIEDGFASEWKEDEDGNIIIADGEEEILLERSLQGYTYTGNLNGSDMEIELEKADKKPECFSEHPELTFGIKYGKQDTSSLCNYMQDGQYLIDGSRIYGKYFIDGKCTFSCGTINEDGEEITVEDAKTFETGGQAKFLVKEGKHIYYLWAPADGSTESIRRVNTETGETETLREGDVDYVQLRFGKIYFADAKFRFCVMNTDGDNEEVVLDKEVYMPYVIDKGWIIYQDDGDGEKLHLTNPASGYDRAVTGERTYSWTITGKTLYYTSTGDKEDEGKHKCRLHRMSLNELKTAESVKDMNIEVSEKHMGDSFEINSKSIYGGDGTHEALDAWNTYANKLYENGGQETYLLYLTDKYEVRGKINQIGNFTEITIRNIKTEKEGVI